MKKFKASVIYVIKYMLSLINIITLLRVYINKSYTSKLKLSNSS